MRMTKTLLIGYNPPQIVPTAKIEAAHYRTWQFLEPLLDDGHEVCLCAGTRDEVAGRENVPRAWRERLIYHPIAFGAGDWAKQMQVVHDSFQPECVVAVNFSHCLYATKLKTDAPIWMEVYGDVLTIMQAAAYRMQSDRGLETQISFMREILRKGDIFSGCGRAQCHMMVGELAMTGRLNRRTFGYEFTRAILPGSPPNARNAPGTAATCADNLSNADGHVRQLLTQHRILDTDFVVLWCGGYNTWTDVDTLFQGLESAMSCNPRLHYVSVGANTYSAPDNVYDRFVAMAAASPYRERYHMLGWRPWSEMATYYHESNVGINIDALHYETIFGTRTRLVEMIASGLPVITSLGAELSFLLRDAGVALTFDVGDWEQLGHHLEQVGADADLTRQMAVAAYRYAQEDLSFATTTRPLREWVQDPSVAPDKHSLSRSDQLRSVEHRARSTLRQVMWHVSGTDR
jgi:glycosyltransferase involved in cell wall biosynthesis